MNLRLIAAAFLCLATGFSVPAFASDPCEIVLCMYGKAIGASQSECNSAVKKFFSLNSFKKKGRFNPGKTATIRRAMLGECKAADPAAISKIIGQFGRIRG